MHKSAYYKRVSKVQALPSFFSVTKIEKNVPSVRFPIYLETILRIDGLKLIHHSVESTEFYSYDFSNENFVKSIFIMELIVLNLFHEISYNKREYVFGFSTLCPWSWNSSILGLLSTYSFT